MLNINHSTRGDTLIEVLFAVSIFSLIAVGGLSIMNQGTAVAQRALEITLVRQEIDAQAETLRFINSSYIAAYQPGLTSAEYNSNPAATQWRTLSNVTTSDPVSEFSSGTSCPASSGALRANSFVFNTKKVERTTLTPANFRLSQTFSQVRYDTVSNVVNADGIWIEAIKRVETDNSNNQINTGYIDFHIRACWDSIGQSAPVTMGTIVRLYEPRG